MIARSDKGGEYVENHVLVSHHRLVFREFRSVTAAGNNRWTKWWWLRIDQIAHWSADERRASVTFLLTWIVTATLAALWGWGVLSLLHVLNSEAALLFSFFVALSGTLFGLRWLTTLLFGDTVMDGDDAAAARLGGRVHLPTNEPLIRGSWWFLDKRIGLTEAQRTAQRRMMVVFLVVLLLTFLPAVYLLIDFGASEGLALLIVLLTVLPTELYAARRISIWCWPDLIKKAERYRGLE
jgi:hypothetical protein